MVGGSRGGYRDFDEGEAIRGRNDQSQWGRHERVAALFQACAQPRHVALVEAKDRPVQYAAPSCEASIVEGDADGTRGDGVDHVPEGFLSGRFLKSGGLGLE